MITSHSNARERKSTERSACEGNEPKSVRERTNESVANAAQHSTSERGAAQRYVMTIVSLNLTAHQRLGKKSVSGKARNGANQTAFPREKKNG